MKFLQSAQSMEMRTLPTVDIPELSPFNNFRNTALRQSDFTEHLYFN